MRNGKKTIELKSPQLRMAMIMTMMMRCYLIDFLFFARKRWFFVYSTRIGQKKKFFFSSASRCVLVLCAFKLNKNSEWGGKVWFFSSSSSSSSFSFSFFLSTSLLQRLLPSLSTLLFLSLFSFVRFSSSSCSSLLTSRSASFKQVRAHIATTFNCLEVKYAHMHGLYVRAPCLSLSLSLSLSFC